MNEYPIVDQVLYVCLVTAVVTAAMLIGIILITGLMISISVETEVVISLLLLLAHGPYHHHSHHHSQSSPPSNHHRQHHYIMMYTHVLFDFVSSVWSIDALYIL